MNGVRLVAGEKSELSNAGREAIICMMIVSMSDTIDSTHKKMIGEPN